MRLSGAKTPGLRFGFVHEARGPPAGSAGDSAIQATRRRNRGDAIGAMRIVLPGGLAGQLFLARRQHPQLDRYEGIPDRLSGGAIAGQRELQRLHGRDQRHGSEVHQRMPCNNLAFLDIEAICFVIAHPTASV